MRVRNWVIEVSVVALMVVTAVGLASCSGNGNRDRTTGVADYEIRAEDCVVKYIDNPKGYNFFIAKCPAASETTTYQRPSGKASHPTATVVTTEDLRKQLEIAEAKEKALSKLTDTEKKLLGVQ